MKTLLMTLALALGGIAAGEPVLDITVEVTLGRDLGQPLGSLFEARDETGRVALGGAFPDAFSTYLRDNNRLLVFYVKGVNGTPTVTPVGKPYDSEHNGARLLVDGDDLITMYREFTPVEVKKLGPDGAWVAADGTWRDVEGVGGVQYVNNKRLMFTRHAIHFDGREVFRTSEPSLIYYSCGRVFVAQSQAKRLLVAPWDPQSGTSIDEASCQSFPMEGAPFVFGTWRDHVLLATNIGNVYVYRGGKVDTLRTSDGESWQAYSLTMLNDELVIGHYPSGSLYTYKGEGLQPFEPALPVPEGVSPHAREAQTLAVYGGDLYVGVWPWGEVWRFDPDAKTWHFMSRVFSDPAPSADVVEPYAREMQGRSDVYNYWGQRIVSLTPYRNSLYIGTMNKQGKAYKPEEHTFLTPEAVEQYGRVYRLDAAAQVVAPFVWKDKTSFRFECDGERLVMYQDGRTLGEAAMADPLGVQGALQFTLGKGVCGEFAGKAELRP